MANVLVALGGAERLEQSPLLVAHVRHVAIVVFEVAVLSSVIHWLLMHRYPRQFILRHLHW
jgi:hypothetical protein